jgi:ferredoxin
MKERLHVDRTRCDGAGLCAELLPELIALDDWGYPILHNAPVPDRLRELARRAVDACPVLALRLAAANRATDTQSSRIPLQARTLAPHAPRRAPEGG